MTPARALAIEWLVSTDALIPVSGTDRFFKAGEDALERACRKLQDLLGLEALVDEDILRTVYHSL